MEDREKQQGVYPHLFKLGDNPPPDKEAAMDGTAAIESNLQALKRILASLFAMAGLTDRQSAIGGRQTGSAPPADGPATLDCQLPTADCSMTVPRHLRLSILSLLRPAESAARRLIIAAARGLTVTLPPPRIRKPKPATAEPFLRRFGIAVTMSPALILPRSRGRGTTEGGGGGGLGVPALPLFDPPRRFRPPARRTVPAHAARRILFPGVVQPHSLPPPPSAVSSDDPIDATRLTLRLAALAAALDDLPGQAKRFARWQARRAARLLGGKQAGRIRRVSPLRPGRPPGGRLARFDPAARTGRNIREVDEVLVHAHALALYALAHPDTS